MSAACPNDPWLSFAQDLERERPSLLRYLQGQRVPLPDQRELAGEVILVAWASRHTYDPSRAALRTWLTGIAANLLSHYRKLARHRREQLFIPEHFNTLGDDDLDTELRLMLKEHRAILDRMLEKLPEERRVVFVLYELQEMKLSEIGRLLGISEDTAWSRLRSARDELVEIARRWHAADAHRGRRSRGAVLLPLLASAEHIAPGSGLLRLASLSGVKWIQAASLGMMIAVVVPSDAPSLRAPPPALALFPAALAEIEPQTLREEAEPAQVIEPAPPASPPPRADAGARSQLRRPSIRPSVGDGEHYLIHLARAHKSAGHIAKALDALDRHSRRYPAGEYASERDRMREEIRRQ